MTIPPASLSTDVPAASPSAASRREPSDPAADSLLRLGLPALLSALSSRARSDLGQARCLRRTLTTDAGEIQASLGLVAEARLLSEQQRLLPLGGARDVREAVERAGKGGLLESRDLVAVAGVLGAMARTRDVLQASSAQTPRLFQIGQALPDLTRLARRIETSFEPSGELTDRASPDLGPLRDRSRGLHRDIKSRVEGLLADREMEPSLREKYFTIRNERYVLPVKSSGRWRVPGIVHNASQSGQTLFVEPQALIGLGNDLAIAQSMVLEEERRILQELTDAVGENADEIVAGLEAVAQLDEAEACARLSNDLHAYTPELISPREPFDLRGLRHPLLVLQGKQVVASDVRLDAPARALIISGPNAGGKTVTLSSIGLCSLMVRLGLPIPAREGSRLPLYPGVYAAIGDAQNLDRDLSTFSAHVTALRDILDRASPGSLVLIDEIAADTDPREGAALAASVLEALLERGSTILVTTHLDELKALGLTDPRCANAHVGFDAERLAPTYRLHLGSPGASSAIEIARRVGLSEVICERARASLQGKAGPLTRALESLEATRAAADRERAEAARLREEAQRQRDEARRQLETIEAQTRLEMDVARRKLLADLEAAQVQVSELVAELQIKPGLARAAEVQHQLRQRESVQKLELEPRPGPSAPGDREEALRVGGRVRLSKLNREGQLLELHGDEAVVQAGAVRMRVATRDLVGLEARKSPSKPAASSAPGHGPAAPPRRLIPESCDLRGLRADEALRLVEAFLDRVYGEGAVEAVIIHGHGTGALKSSVRDYLTASPYLSGWRPSPDDGSTEVTLKGS